MNRDQLLRYATAVALLGLVLRRRGADAAGEACAEESAGRQAAINGHTGEHPQTERRSEDLCAELLKVPYTPEGFSARISGTIVRHMRVRASLSEHDEQELLRFFNP